MLDRGWHLSPTNNSDTHALAPAKNGRTTGIFATSLDLASIRQAMLARRTFGGTTGADSSLSLKAEGCWMGARLQGYLTANFEAEAIDSKTGYTNIQLVTTTGKVIKTCDCKMQTTCKVSASVQLTPSSDKYVFAIANRSDDAWMISAPIWIEE